MIKCICLNMWEGGKLMDAIIDFLAEEKPDILALQEVYDGRASHLPTQYRTMQVLSQAMPELPFNHFAPAFLDQTPVGLVEQGNAIFSRFPIVDSNVIFSDVPYGRRQDQSNIPYTPRNLQQVTLALPDRQMHIFNTQGIWGHDGKDNPRRLAFSELIATEIKGKQNVLLCGDFNVQMKTLSIAKIEEHLANAFQDRLASSFNLRHKQDPCFATCVVDAIFYSRDLTLKEAYSSPLDISDHLPLVARLLFNPGVN